MEKEKSMLDKEEEAVKTVENCVKTMGLEYTNGMVYEMSIIIDVLEKLKEIGAYKGKTAEEVLDDLKEYFDATMNFWIDVAQNYVSKTLDKGTLD